MTSYLNNDYDVMNYFAKYEKFLPYSITIPSFMTVGSQMPELDRRKFAPGKHEQRRYESCHVWHIENGRMQSANNHLFTYIS